MFKPSPTSLATTGLLLALNAAAQTPTSGAAAPMAPMARIAESRPAALESNWTPLRLPTGERIALLGGSYLMAIDEEWGFGPSVYGAAKGNYGGVFTVGLTAQRRWRLGQSTHLAAGLYAGAGGGLSSSQVRFGGGLMLRPELSIRTEMGSWYAGVSLNHVRFPSGNVRGSSVGFVLGRAGSFAGFSPLDAGRQGRASQRTGLGFDEIAVQAGFYKPRQSTRNRSGDVSNARMGKAGADLRHYIAEGSWWGVEASGAAQGGADGYMEVLANAGQDWALGHPSLRVGGQLALGLGGGGNVDTGSGWLLRAGPTLRWQTPWGPSLRLDAGLARATAGNFKAGFVRLGLSMPLDRGPRFGTFGLDDVPGTVRTQQLFTSIQHLPKVRFKDGRQEAVTHLGLMMTRELSPSVYGAAQAGSAAWGSAGAYSYGLVGLGLQTQPLASQPRWRVGAELLAGAAGGGGVAVRGGAVLQGEAWTQLNLGEQERLRLRVGLGQWRTLRGEQQSSPVLNVSVGYAFGSLLR
ncbi:hypothetical protein [Roseateles sp.]|uniref:hypothetical protein n=1 Tax=Roseateles sp. TaxID=1971397 RepID=UPI003D102A82